MTNPHAKQYFDIASEQDNKFMRKAIELGYKTSIIENAGGAFGCVIVKNGEIIAVGASRVVKENDPTWHAEMEAIRNACKKLGTFKLHGCTLYSSSEPCPMCAAACFWAGITRIFYASTVEDAKEYGDFDDSMIYHELIKPIGQRSIPAQELLRDEAINVWKEYKASPDKIHY